MRSERNVIKKKVPSKLTPNKISTRLTKNFSSEFDFKSQKFWTNKIGSLPNQTRKNREIKKTLYKIDVKINDAKRVKFVIFPNEDPYKKLAQFVVENKLKEKQE